MRALLCNRNHNNNIKSNAFPRHKRRERNFISLLQSFFRFYSIVQRYAIVRYLFFISFIEHASWKRIANHLQKSSRNKFVTFFFLSSPCITQQTSSAPKLRLINLDGFINVLGGFRLIYDFPQKSHSFCLLASL